jgi:superfamily II DNA or RNA helicase
MIDLWEHQINAVCKIEKAWLDGINSICYQLPTGGGKTRILRTIVDNHSRSKKVIYIIAHRKNLVKQLSKEVESIGIKHGVIAANTPYLRYRVQVASLQTIVRRIDKIPEPEIMIIDEFHHCKSKSYLSLIETWSNSKILGVTATPARLDGSPLKDVCDKLIKGPSVQFLIENNFLSDYSYYAPSNIDLKGVHVQAGDYSKSDVLVRVDKKTITGNAVEHYRKYADHKPAIASCVSILHAEHVAQEFREAGYKSMAIHSKLSDKEIDYGLNGLKNGNVEVLCQCDLIGEGIDIPGASVLIGLRPTNSLVIFLQHIGRVLRYQKGKKAIILDHVGNWERHGLPKDDRKWSLDGVIRKEKDALDYKRCPECLQPVPKSTRVCSYCGYQWTEEVDGELVDVNQMKIMKKQRHKNLLRRVRTEARCMDDACDLAVEFGYKRGYGYYLWKNLKKRA